MYIAGVSTMYFSLQAPGQNEALSGADKTRTVMSP